MRIYALVLAGLLLAASVADAGTATPRIGYLVQSPLTDPPSPERAAFLDGFAPVAVPQVGAPEHEVDARLVGPERCGGERGRLGGRHVAGLQPQLRGGEQRSGVVGDRGPRLPSARDHRLQRL